MTVMKPRMVSTFDSVRLMASWLPDSIAARIGSHATETAS